MITITKTTKKKVAQIALPQELSLTFKNSRIFVNIKSDIPQIYDIHALLCTINDLLEGYRMYKTISEEDTCVIVAPDDNWKPCISMQQLPVDQPVNVYAFYTNVEEKVVVKDEAHGYITLAKMFKEGE